MLFFLTYIINPDSSPGGARRLHFFWGFEILGGEMPKLIVGRRVEYVEVYEIDTDKFITIRDDLDLCKRLLWFANESKGLKHLQTTFDRVSKNPVFPVTDCYLPENKKLGGES